MQLVRLRNASGVQFIYPHLRQPIDCTIDEFAERLKRSLSDGSDDLYALVEINTDKNGAPVVSAFVIAYAPPERDYGYLLAAWAEEGKLVSDQMLDIIKTWLENKGRKSLRFEAKPDETMPVRLQFSLVSMIVETKLQEK